MKSLPEIKVSNARKSKKTAHPVGVPDMSGVSALASSLSRKPAPKKPALALDPLLAWCSGWLWRAREALNREGWEEGIGLQEATDALTAVLFNLDHDEGSERPLDVANVKRVKADKDPLYYPPKDKASRIERSRKS